MARFLNLRKPKIIAGWLLALLIGVCLFWMPSKSAKQLEPAYYKHFKVGKSFYKRKFYSKINSPSPPWMQEQIHEDFSPFLGKKISVRSLDAFEAELRLNEQIVRYRIVNNQVYLADYRPIDWEPVDRFQIALLTLCKLIPLPNIDFLVNHADGTAETFFLPDHPEETAPIFGWAKLKTIPMILIPDWRSLSTWWFNDIRKLVEGKNFKGKRLAWDERENSAFWRGAYSEHFFRVKIAELSKSYPECLDAGLTTHMPHLTHLVKSPATYEEHLQNKYLPILDGVMCSYPGYQWRLLSGSVVFKQESAQIQWFYRALQPNVHYIPIQNDLSDLIEKIQWAQNHDAECAKIAEEAKRFVLDNLLFDDVYRYFYLVLVRYASLLDSSFVAEWKKTPKDPRWTRLAP